MTQPQLQIIVQAGGRGSRLRHHTWNKPKCLVSVRGTPLLYHLFRQYPQAKFHVIGDYAFEQLQKYLKVNPPNVDYQLVQTTEKGTLAGIDIALDGVEKESPLMIVWSDLILGAPPQWPNVDGPVVGVTSAFTCRWSLTEEGKLEETTASHNGIPGIFYFPRASLMPRPPQQGEFVKWFAATIPQFSVLDCLNLEELGDFARIEESNSREGFCRFFNKVDVGEQEVTKYVIDSQYEEVHKNEIAWYVEAQKLGFRRIPKIHSTSPLTMQRIKGQHAYDMTDLSAREKRAMLSDYLDALTSLHNTAARPAVPAELNDVYLAKTISRVESVSDIIPGYDSSVITVNGKKCRNFFAPAHRDILMSIMPKLQTETFVPIHGDPTFSNTLVDDNLKVWFIDPRGYFSKPGIWGDPSYDFAKVYYSAVGGYDAFNRKRFKLHVDGETVEILMDEPIFAKTAQGIFADNFGPDMAKIEALHGLIWLALSGYAKDDIDSVIGAFYLGLYWLEDGISKL